MGTCFNFFTMSITTCDLAPWSYPTDCSWLIQNARIGMASLTPLTCLPPLTCTHTLVLSPTPLPTYLSVVQQRRRTRGGGERERERRRRRPGSWVEGGGGGREKTHTSTHTHTLLRQKRIKQPGIFVFVRVFLCILYILV